jgi:S-adenosylmethionine/arginine decarboxylase-like enzyme
MCGAAHPEKALAVIDEALRPLVRNVRTVERGQL